MGITRKKKEMKAVVAHNSYCVYALEETVTYKIQEITQHLVGTIFTHMCTHVFTEKMLKTPWRYWKNTLLPPSGHIIFTEIKCKIDVVFEKQQQKWYAMIIQKTQNLRAGWDFKT